MKTTPLADRIERFLFNYPEHPYIPLHPSDYNKLKAEGRLGAFPKPLYRLGAKKAEEDQ